MSVHNFDNLSGQLTIPDLGNRMVEDCAQLLQTALGLRSAGHRASTSETACGSGEEEVEVDAASPPKHREEKADVAVVGEKVSSSSTAL